MNREVEGWGGRPLRKHVEDAQSAADTADCTATEALDLSRGNCDDLVTIDARVSALEVRLAVVGDILAGRDHD